MVLPQPILRAAIRPSNRLLGKLTCFSTGLRSLREELSWLGWSRNQQAAGDGLGQPLLQSAWVFVVGVFGYIPGPDAGPAAASPGVKSSTGGMGSKNCTTKQPSHPWGLHPALLPVLLLLTVLRAVSAIP